MADDAHQPDIAERTVTATGLTGRSGLWAATPTPRHLSCLRSRRKFLLLNHQNGCRSLESRHYSHRSDLSSSSSRRKFLTFSDLRKTPGAGRGLTLPPLSLLRCLPKQGCVLSRLRTRRPGALRWTPLPLAIRNETASPDTEILHDRQLNSGAAHRTFSDHSVVRFLRSATRRD